MGKTKDFSIYIDEQIVAGDPIATRYAEFNRDADLDLLCEQFAAHQQEQSELAGRFTGHGDAATAMLRIKNQFDAIFGHADDEEARS